MESLTKEMNWMSKANCKDMDTELFFPDNGQTISKFVREVCQSCDVRTECLNYALRHGLTDGMWGGYSPRERRGMRSSHVYS